MGPGRFFISPLTRIAQRVMKSTASFGEQSVCKEGQTLGEWSRRREPMRDEGDVIAGNPRPYTPWGIAWRICLAILIIYVLLTAAFVLHG
jgi:hypothetical protein